VKGKYTAETAYRSSVLPLSIFLMLAGTILAVCFWVVRIAITSPLPFVESEMLNRHAFGFVSLACVIIGLGLMVRNRFAWYALLVYLAIAVVIPAMLVFDTRSVAHQGVAFPIVGSLMNGCVSIGIYLALRPAFRLPHRQNDPSSEIGGSDTEQNVQDTHR
jgi:uncharacterized membrane protein